MFTVGCDVLHFSRTDVWLIWLGQDCYEHCHGSVKSAWKHNLTILVVLLCWVAVTCSNKGFPELTKSSWGWPVCEYYWTPPRPLWDCWGRGGPRWGRGPTSGSWYCLGERRAAALCPAPSRVSERGWLWWRKSLSRARGSSGGFWSSRPARRSPRWESRQDSRQPGLEREVWPGSSSCLSGCPAGEAWRGPEESGVWGQ